jgi:hypothetical protein
VAGVSTRYVLAIVVVVAVVAVVVALRVRRGRTSLQVRPLDAAAAERYFETFANIERDFDANPQVAVAQARGIVEEVLRRMGFPDRIDAAQKARDLSGHDRKAATALATAERALRQDGGDALRQALTSYREVLDQLLRPAGGT